MQSEKHLRLMDSMRILAVLLANELYIPLDIVRAASRDASGGATIDADVYI